VGGWRGAERSRLLARLAWYNQLQTLMAKKQNLLVKLDKSLAERALGYARGRPTLSRRVGRGIDSVLGCGEDAGTHAFHLALVVGAAVIGAKALKK
jgi:hypothetical protein